MKVLTIKQPFATLIAEGVKEFEFRTWKTKFRGEFLIHAGKGVDKKAMKKFAHYGFDYPSGCIIAKANLTDCVYIDDIARKMLQEKNKEIYSSVIEATEWNGYGFKLENVKKVVPMEVNGKLNFWEYEGEIHERKN